MRNWKMILRTVILLSLLVLSIAFVYFGYFASMMIALSCAWLFGVLTHQWQASTAPNSAQVE